MVEKRTLRGMTWSDPRGYDPLIAASAAFAQRHPDVELTWDKRSLQGFESTPVETLARDYDLMIIDHPHVGAIVDEDCLLPIDMHGDPEALKRLEAQTVGKSFHSYFYGGHQWALPVDAACQVQAIRPDLIPRPLTTYAQVLELARAGGVVWPLRPPHVLMALYTLTANLGASFPVTRGAQINRAAGRTALATMQALYDAVDPACREMDPIAALDALAEGNRFALCPLTYLYAPYAAHGYRTHPIAFHDMPTLGRSGPLGSALGGTGIAISSRTAHPELCSAFALWVASDTVQRGLYAQNNGQPGNAVAWGDTDVNAAVGNAYANTRMTHEAAWLRPRHAGYMGFQEDGSLILLDALAGKTAPDTALDALQTRFDESFPT
ncbi:carbohydrate ABC transporter substrate-binding protein [Celeribacter sp.]|uniref:carbohydrate ABC transporter substrate-binding protein n=1 Tax=Celeribacter sp. TaxID=1890673 RepID=UPI003A92C6F3